MFRVNLQVTTKAAITAGGGVPGGTNGVLFIDTADSNQLKVILPSGVVYVAEKVADSNLITFIAD